MSSSPTISDFDEKIQLSFQDCFEKKPKSRIYIHKYPEGPAYADMSSTAFFGLEGKVIIVGILTSLKNFSRSLMSREQICVQSGLTTLNILKKGFSIYLISSIINYYHSLTTAPQQSYAQKYSTNRFLEAVININEVKYNNINQSKNNQKMLEFCQECQVYHNTTQINGERVISQCEKKINQLTNCNTSQPSGDIIYFNRHDFSPKSKASFTSIVAHPTLHPQLAAKPNQPSIKIKFSSPPTNINLPIQSYQLSNQKASSINICIIPVRNSTLALAEIKKPPINNNKQNNIFLKLKPKNLLSTIKEEKSESSPSKTSMISSQTKIKSQMRSTYQFKHLRKSNKNLNQLGNEPFIQNDNTFCCC